MLYKDEPSPEAKFTGLDGFGLPPTVKAKKEPSPPAAYTVDLFWEWQRAVIPPEKTA